MQQQHQTGPTANLPPSTQARTDVASEQPDRAPADDNGDQHMSHRSGAHREEEAHGVATAADPVANFSFVGENQPAPGTADVAPAEQAVTTKVGLQLGSQRVADRSETCSQHVTPLCALKEANDLQLCGKEMFGSKGLCLKARFSPYCHKFPRPKDSAVSV